MRGSTKDRGPSRTVHAHRANRRMAGLVFGLMLVFGATDAFAQARAARQPKVIELEEMVVEGKVSKPQVFYVLGRSSTRYEGITLKRSFVGRIIESARTNPF